MSEEIGKTVLRCHLPQLAGKSGAEVAAFFTSIGLPPQNEADDGDGPQWWEGEYRGVQDYETKEWALEQIVQEESAHEWDGLDMTIAELNDLALALVRKCKSRGQVRIQAYTWYNGVDEPVHVPRVE